MCETPPPQNVAAQQMKWERIDATRTIVGTGLRLVRLLQATATRAQANHRHRLLAPPAGNMQPPPSRGCH